MSRPFDVDLLETRALFHPGHGFHAEINFQPANTSTPANYLADVGSKYGLRSNGFTYGWDADISAWTRKRNSSLSEDTRYDTLIHAQPSGQSRRWDLLVPNGTYDVRVVAGDASYFDSVYKINAENKIAVNGTPNSSNRWIEGTVRVDVADGKLTLTSAGGSQNNKIAFIEVKQVEDNDDPPTNPQPSIGWSAIAPLPLARTEAQQAVYGGKLYIFGGFYNSSWKTTTRSDVYDPETNSWSRLPDMPALLTHAATVLDGDRVIFAGGFIGNYEAQETNKVYVYDISDRDWYTLPSLPAGRGGGGMGIVDRKLYFFGGGTRNSANQHDADYGNTWSLDLNNASAGWAGRASLPTPRNHLAYATVGGKVYAIGGQLLGRENTGNQSVVHAYNPATNKWSAVASLPQTLGHIHTGTVVHDGRIIIAGGVTNGFVTTKGILSYDAQANKWTRVRDMPVSRKSVNMMIEDNQIYIVGGGNMTALASGYQSTWSAAASTKNPAIPAAENEKSSSNSVADDVLQY